MTQEIVTYIIISFVIGYVLFSLYKTVFSKVGKQGCSGGCNCDAKVLRKELLKNKLTR